MQHSNFTIDNGGLVVCETLRSKPKDLEKIPGVIVYSIRRGGNQYVAESIWYQIDKGTGRIFRAQKSPAVINGRAICIDGQQIRVLRAEREAGGTWLSISHSKGNAEVLHNRIPPSPTFEELLLLLEPLKVILFQDLDESMHDEGLKMVARRLADNFASDNPPVRRDKESQKKRKASNEDIDIGFSTDTVTPMMGDPIKKFKMSETIYAEIPVNGVDGDDDSVFSPLDLTTEGCSDGITPHGSPRINLFLFIGKTHRLKLTEDILTASHFMALI
ncbi:hypothetical protein PROFUN_13218 [Planoprotostelium fungivorum]|uniref:Uncharacterized protein n=1 Tax=Planoprotostelium fungivorum TaxID=1890364 RepID=A0A2P6MYV2_9EUKA|nr:hypothetical protein PROFUN_13218 [Planoprotostelium fungivorum]